MIIFPMLYLYYYMGLMGLLNFATNTSAVLAGSMQGS